MLTFLFWNIAKKPLLDLIGTLVDEHGVDILILAESRISESKLQQIDAVSLQPSMVSGLQVLTRFAPKSLEPAFESERFSVHRLTLTGARQILLAITHFPSKLFWSSESQALECGALIDVIREQESAVGHTRTVLVGDLNMNPFEAGVVGANGFHAVMARDVAARGSRKVQGRTYPFFYNPMWSNFGDGSKGPPGTYYFERAEHVNYFWNMFDQVLIRPDLMDSLRTDVEILTKAGSIPLVAKNGRPDGLSASDHLPILFRLDL